MNEFLHPGFERIDRDYTLSPVDRPVLVNQHGIAAASELLTLSTLGRSDGAVLASIALYRGKVGVYHPMTPEGARLLAGKLNTLADLAEQEAAGRARAMLDATLSRAPDQPGQPE